MTCVVALDNDECIGSWGELSMLYGFVQSVLKTRPVPEMFIAIMVKTHAVRPGLRQFYKGLLDLKAAGKISHIYMCTAASNETGWVSFLYNMLEIWYGARIYDGMICNETLKAWHRAQNTAFCDSWGCVFKDLNLIRSLHKSCKMMLAVDDRPQYIVNGIPFGVLPYNVNFNPVQELSMFNIKLNAEQTQALHAMASQVRIHPETSLPTDLDLLRVFNAIKTLLLQNIWV
jgi:hypothetical protein